MTRLVVCLCAAGLFVGLAQGQLIVGNDQSGTATIYNVDVSTGVATPIYSSGTSEAKPWGMAYDAATNTLYWNNGGTLYSSPFGANLTPTTLGSMSYQGGSVNFVGLGFNNGKLLGTRNISTEGVYEIDPVTLEATLLGTYPSTFDFGGVDFDAGNLYGLSDATGGGQGRGLYSLVLGTGDPVFHAPYPAGETDIDGLAVSGGLAYYVTDGPNTTQANFYVFDVGSGQQVGTLPSPFTGSGTFSAAAFVPEPATLGLLALGALGLLRRR